MGYSVYTFEEFGSEVRFAILTRPNSFDEEVIENEEYIEDEDDGEYVFSSSGQDKLEEVLNKLKPFFEKEKLEIEEWREAESIKIEFFLCHKDLSSGTNILDESVVKTKKIIEEFCEKSYVIEFEGEKVSCKLFVSNFDKHFRAKYS